MRVRTFARIAVMAASLAGGSVVQPASASVILPPKTAITQQNSDFPPLAAAFFLHDLSNKADFQACILDTPFDEHRFTPTNFAWPFGKPGDGEEARPFLC